MYIIVFPKQFEYDSFINIFDNYYVIDISTKTSLFFYLYNDKVYVFLLLIIDKSDIEFLLELMSCFQEIKERCNIEKYPISNFKILLIGSCGCTQNNINDIFSIIETHKN